eukprot:scaffold185834_cov17-Tisochrysis_lutea.AAC.1
MAPPRGNVLKDCLCQAQAYSPAGVQSCQRLGLHQRMGACQRMPLEAIGIWPWTCLSMDTDSGTWTE